MDTLSPEDVASYGKNGYYLYHHQVFSPEKLDKLATLTKDQRAEVAALIDAEVSRQVGTLRADLEKTLAELRERTPEDRAALVVFSGDLDRVLAAFVIATGAWSYADSAAAGSPSTSATRKFDQWQNDLASARQIASTSRSR